MSDAQIPVSWRADEHADVVFLAVELIERARDNLANLAIGDQDSTKVQRVADDLGLVSLALDRLFTGRR